MLAALRARVAATPAAVRAVSGRHDAGRDEPRQSASDGRAVLAQEERQAPAPEKRRLGSLPGRGAALSAADVLHAVAELRREVARSPDPSLAEATAFLRLSAGEHLVTMR
jgi:hypothetical protein